MNNDVFVSLVIPSRKRSDLLKKCIISFYEKAKVIKICLR